MIYKIKYLLWLLFYGNTRERLVPKGFISWLEKQPNKDEIINEIYEIEPVQ